ncbi:radical SAM family heme chaperone HemW [Desulfovibrio litoralis]|uniref:Heme chaperone HemW n=1 Tax=Desulfovibrio litoralis DSM 11393 TaxID=1121455 RepID=A0A1M7SYI5_9BACT|nr:radical SAM family heme chaperone HemW [Desulfovibrio litoralis]SHN63496.1 oxygen-independent coproporphyrinogen-3 oxidase [Desulfovibrio litoralis DSM 11393]
MLLYIHVPFCKTRCNYCAFSSIAVGDLQMLSGYNTSETPNKQLQLVDLWLETLLLEIKHWGTTLNNNTLTTIFFGGGTPSLLSEDKIALIINCINKYFTLNKGIEITIEANPESSGNTGYLYSLLKLGVNRLSLGVQSLDDANLHELGRSHTVRHVYNTVNVARQAGFNNINLDLIWGLPSQSATAWMNTLKEVVKLKPEHLSCYGLSIEPNTKFAHELAAEKLHLPNERTQSLMFVQGAAFLEELGYIHYEISNFARMGFKCLHNMGYWEAKDYLGLGPSATSTISQQRWTNPSDLSEWSNNVKNGLFSSQIEHLDQQTQLVELIMLGLRTAKGLNIKEYNALSGKNFMNEYKNIIEALHKKRLLRIKNGYLILTNNGMLVSNSIIEAFTNNIG